MFAAVHYIESSAAAVGCNRKNDVVEVDQILDFNAKDYKRKKFKVTTPEGSQVWGLILAIGSKTTI